MLHDTVIDPQSGDRFSIVVCEDCDLGRTLPVPEDLGRYYAATYHGRRHGVTEAFCLRRRLSMLSRCQAQPGRLLDFGCGDGGFMLAAANAGWRVQGVEMKPEDPRSRGLDVVETIDAASGPFDAITLWHSLEHVESPLATLTELTRLLRPGGSLVVAVPNRRSWQAAAFGPNWFHLDVPRHVSHFSPDALQRMLGAAGLVVERRWNLETEIDWFGWPQSLLNVLLPRRNVLHDIATGRNVPHTTTEKMANLALGALLTAASAPLVPLAAALGRGAILVMAARSSS